MLNQQQELRRRVVEILSMEDLVPKDHLLRQVDGAVDFIHIYDFVEELYTSTKEAQNFLIWYSINI